MGLSSRTYLTPSPPIGHLASFATNDLAASLTDSITEFSYAHLGGGASHRFWLAPFGTVITAMTMTINTLATNVGTFTISIFVDVGAGSADAGAAYDLVFDPTANGDQGQVKRYASPLVIAAPVVDVGITTGRVDLRATTSADWSPTTSDCAVHLWGYLQTP